MTTTWTAAVPDAAGDCSMGTEARGSHGRLTRLAHVLCEPAYVQCGGVPLTVPQRLWLHHVIEQVAAALSTACAKAVTLAVTQGRVTESQADTAQVGPGLCIRLRNVTGDARIQIDLDDGACRALADAMLIQIGGSRGSGPVTGEERGVIEFLALHVLERMDTLDSPIRGVIIEQVEAASEARSDSHSRALDIQLAVAGLGGAIRLLVPWNRLHCECDPPVAATDEPHIDRSISLSVALSPIRISIDEFTALRPGDLLLPGSATIGSLAAACEVVSDRGWSIASARFVAHRAGGVTIAIDDIRPRVHALTTSETHLTIVPTMGRRVVALSTVANWSAGTTVDFAIDLETPMNLLFAGSEIGVCEPVMLEEELALRILELRGACAEHDAQRRG